MINSGLSTIHSAQASYACDTVTPPGCRFPFLFASFIYTPCLVNCTIVAIVKEDRFMLDSVLGCSSTRRLNEDRRLNKDRGNLV